MTGFSRVFSKTYYIYMMSNKRRSTIYVGVTGSIRKRVWEHKNKIHQRSFTARYNLLMLVYFETFESIHNAIKREKQLKGGSRQKKVDLILKMNPKWTDLSHQIL